MSPRDPDASGDGLPEEPLQSNTRDDNVGELEATAAMCHHCFDTLIFELKGLRHRHRWRSTTTSTSADTTAANTLAAADSVTTPDFVETLPSHTVECPLFVTWDKRRHRRHRNHHRHDAAAADDDTASFELRGCIGTLAPKPLASSIGEYAIISALRDRRFHPVSMAELPRLRVAVSLLVKYEECQHCHDWSVGIHGIMIRWTDSRTRVEYSATYLPEVAKDQGWDQETTVISLVRKAGYHGSVSDDLLRVIQCTRYQSSKHRLTYDEYVHHRGGHDPVRTAMAGGDLDDNEGSPGNCLIM